MQPYAVLSDLHCHAWSAFAGPGPDGVNTRLAIILDELERAAETLIAAGGTRMVIAGDIFHVRGSIDPEVFNPTHERFRRILEMGVRIYAIPGNHDLKGKDTTELGNAIQTLGALDGFTVVTEPTLFVDERLALVPWRYSLEELRKDLEAVKGEVLLAAGRGEIADPTFGVDRVDVFIHAGIDGVLIGTPDHGLTAKELAGYGFRRVFAGHYHHHKVMEDGKVISIGATTHQKWSDVGTRAGFLIVDDMVTFHSSHAPFFVDISASTNPDEIPLIVDGNYVRVRDMRLTDMEIAKLTQELRSMGAGGLSVQVAREVVSARGAPVAKAASLSESIANYINDLELPDPGRVLAEAEDILTAVRAVAA